MAEPFERPEFTEECAVGSAGTKPNWTADIYKPKWFIERTPAPVSPGIPGLTAPPVETSVESAASGVVEKPKDDAAYWDGLGRDVRAFIRRSATEYLPAVFGGLSLGFMGTAFAGRARLAIQVAGLALESYGFAKTMQTAMQPIKLLESRGATPEYAQSVGQVAQDVPPPLRSFLYDSGCKVVACDRVSNYLSYWEKQSPPSGYPKGAGWDNCGGLFNGKDIVVAEEVKVGDTWYKKSPEHTTKHEVGHAMDELLAPWSYMSFSNTPKFIAAYEKDVAAMKLSDRGRWDYYLQKGQRGRSEAFAEVFAYVVRSNRYAGDIQYAFPNVAYVVQERMDEVRAQNPEEC